MLLLFCFFVFVIVRLQPEWFFAAVLNSVWSDLSVYRYIRNTRFLRFFPTQPQCCLTFSQIELQIALVHIAIIILSHILYLLYLFHV